VGRIRVVAVTFAIALAALTPGLDESTGAAHREYTVAFVTDGTLSGRELAIARGGEAAAKALGVRYMVADTPYEGPGPPGTKHPFHDLIAVYKTLLAWHVDAIATEGYNPSLRPILGKVRSAGIPLLSSGDDIAAARTLWVSESAPAAYAQALADALASQMGRQGEYAIVVQQGQYPIADEWERLAEAYIARAYPAMKLDGVHVGTGAGDQSEVDGLKAFMSAHPNLKGLLAIVPTEAYMAAEAIVQSHEIGHVFSAGNGGGDFGDLLPGFVRSGAAELVYGGDPMKLGYATVWAAHYLLTRHTFKPGEYQVGGPVGLVTYYAGHQELRLGQPLTITRANADRYAGTF
jgi:rhamnose transport system substrate-binding protein